MTDEQIEYLYAIFNSNVLVWWYDPQNGWRQIVKLGEQGHEHVGFFSSLLSDHIDLYNVDVDDLMITSGNLAVWPGVPQNTDPIDHTTGLSVRSRKLLQNKLHLSSVGDILRLTETQLSELPETSANEVRRFINERKQPV